MNWIDAALDLLAREPGILVRVGETRGSVPRETGTCMLVFAQALHGTIGGGHLEFAAIAHARQMLASGQRRDSQRQVLGPSLGQCCGGALQLHFERIEAGQPGALREQLDGPRSPVALFGGGHVGRALVQTLSALPFAVRWIDSRDEIFPAQIPTHVDCEHSDPVEAAVKDLVPGSRVLIMSFSHAEDLEVVMACLRRLRERGDLPFVGLIGSKTKWATFQRRLQERGFTPAELERITCPIGVPGITGKAPEVIAVSVAAQLLQTLA